jgi:hypothetical protein
MTVEAFDPSDAALSPKTTLRGHSTFIQYTAALVLPSIPQMNLFSELHW